MIWESLGKYRDYGLLVIRLGFGLGFLHYHGWRKLVRGPDFWAEHGDAMAHFGITFGYTFFGFLSAFIESIGGLLFAAGLFFRPVCVLMLLNMVVAATGHYVTGAGNPGHAVKNAFLFLGLTATGAGTYSLDTLIASKWRRTGTQTPRPVAG